jgi:hypothetical protein
MIGFAVDRPARFIIEQFRIDFRHPELDSGSYEMLNQVQHNVTLG